VTDRLLEAHEIAELLERATASGADDVRDREKRKEQEPERRHEHQVFHGFCIDQPRGELKA
jgi:hypothetical protein